MDLQRIEDTKNTLMSIATELYQNKVPEGKKHVADVLEDLGIIATWLTEEQQIDYIQTILRPIMDAMETEDGVYLADLINYELIPFIERILED